MGWASDTGGPAARSRRAAEPRAAVLIRALGDEDTTVLAEALAEAGYAVLFARTAAEAEEYTRQRRFDVLVLLVPPGRPDDALEVMAAQQQIDDAPTVVVVLPGCPDDAALRFLRGGAWTVLPAPLPREALLLHVERALEHRRLHAAVELYEASRALLSALSIDDLRSGVLEMARRVLRCPTAVLLLAGASETEVEAFSQGPDPVEAARVARALFPGAPGAAPAEDSGPVGASGLLADRPDLGTTAFEAYAAYPLVVRGRAVGFLVGLRPGSAAPFTAVESQRGALIAVQAALALDNARIYRTLEHLAAFDELTGLHSRRHLFDVVRRSHPEVAASGTSFLMVDVDHFKQVNDRWGHATGDRVLCRVAELLVHATRESDVVARVGGEEFAVLLPNTDERTATDVAERIRAGINAHPQEPRVTVSVGVCTLPGALFHPGEDPIARVSTLMQRADTALYRAKRSGRNRVCVWRARRRELAGA